MRGLRGLFPLLIASSAVAAAPAVATGSGFAFPVPAGYRDVSETMRKKGMAPTTVTVLAERRIMNYQPSITVQKAAIPAHITDLAACTETARNLAGPDGKLKKAAMIDGPAGRTCQMHVVAPEGVALITELHRPKETWLMTCNHADGDATSEAICRRTLAAFRFTK